MEEDLDLGPISEERAWHYTVQTLTHIQSRRPDAAVRVGSTLDFLPLQPMWPVCVEVDGNLVAQFERDGTWLDAQGRTSSWRSIIEGSPRTVGDELLRKARPSTPQRDRALSVRSRDRLPRRREPEPTHTWADDWSLTELPHIPQTAPPWVSLPPWPDRIVVTTYHPRSCTFTGTHPRWGVESLFIPKILQAGHPFANTQPLHPGDVVVTIGPTAGALDILEDTKVWHPQRVLRVQAAGTHSLRVWLLVDREVRHRCLDWDDYPGPRNGDLPRTGSLEGAELHLLLDAFNLAVDCPKCGNRGKPILWGLPAEAPPNYLITGGCVIEPDPPNYACTCGATWVITEQGNYRVIDPDDPEPSTTMF